MIILLALIAAPFALATVLAGLIWTFSKLARWRRRHSRHLRTLTDREVADALAPFGADISIWPARAPKNGSTHE